MTITELRDQERTRLEWQADFDISRPTRERNVRGQFATPPALADEIARYAALLWRRREDAICLLEPALGTGAFYSALLKSVNPGMIQSAVGVEIDPRIAQIARELWQRAGIHVLNDDFTRLQPEYGSANLVLANPPYVRHHHIDAADKVRLQALSGGVLGRPLSGLAGLYCYFVILAHEWLMDDGIGIWLLPSEFMAVNYGAPIRRYLAGRVTLLHVHRYDPADLQFEDALVSSSVVVYRRCPSPSGHQVRMSLGGSLLQPKHIADVPAATLEHSNKWTLFPAREPPLLNGARTADAPGAPPTVPFGTLFRVQRGIATGANGFFILPLQEVTRLRIDRRFLRPILPGSRHLNGAVIETDDQGYPQIERPLALIDTGLPLSEIDRLCPPLANYLRIGEGQGLPNTYLLSRRRPWYRQEDRDPPPFLCSYMGRSERTKPPFRFFWNRSQAIAANTYLLLYPIGPLKALIDCELAAAARVFDLLQGIDAAQLMGEGRVYGGGLYKVEPNELAALDAGAIAEALGLRLECKPVQAQLDFGRPALRL